MFLRVILDSSFLLLMRGERLDFLWFSIILLLNWKRQVLIASGSYSRPLVIRVSAKYYVLMMNWVYLQFYDDDDWL